MIRYLIFFQFFITISSNFIPNHFVPLKFFNSTLDHPIFPDSNRKCTVDSIKSGQWIKGAKNCGIASVYDHELTEPVVTPTDFRRNKIPWEFSDYCWKPLYCEPEKFSVQRFCEILDGRSILLVGDSIQHQFYDALWMQLETPNQPLGQWTVHFNVRTEGIICNRPGIPKKGRLVYLRNDQISVGGVELSVDRPLVLLRNWLSVADSFDILILNKGAHFIKDETIFNKQTEETALALKRLVESRDPKRPPLRIFFRTTPVGHSRIQWDAPAITSLLDHDLDYENILKEMHYFSNDPSEDYGWHKMKQRDEWVIQEFQRVLLPFPSVFQVLDVRDLSFFRPDNHRCNADNPQTSRCDELHYFMPGVADSWVYLLFNVL